MRFYAGSSLDAGDFTYTVESDFGCSNFITKQSTVFKKPVLAVSDNFTENFCVNGTEVDIFGTDGGNQVSERAYFTGDNIVDVDEDGKYKFDPKNYEASPIGTKYDLKFHYTDANNCTDSVLYEFVINKLPDVSISNLDSTSYCPNWSEFSVIGSPGLGIGSNDGFTINDVSFKQFTHNFDPADYSEGTSVEFIYTHTDDDGCENSITSEVGISTLPVNVFSFDNSCTKEITSFSYLGSDIDATFEWVFGDEENTSADMNPEFSFEDIDEYKIVLSVTNPEGCTVTKDTNVLFNDGPIASFSWDLECEGSTVSLFNNSSKKTNVEFTWNIGGEELQSNADTTNYEFNNSGQFNVTLLAQESVKCKDDTTQIVNIRPIVNFDNSIEYVNSFEDDAYAGWAGITLNGDSALNTWENAMPTSVLMNEAADGNKAWMTNSSGSYDLFEQSALTSPCFDLSQLKRPMISFDYWIETQNEVDGAVLQFRVDGSDSWENIGDDENGINWYNYNAISSEPGKSGEGWTGITEGWLEAKHDLDEQMLHNDKLIQFRFAFAVDQKKDLEGFAVDNFRVGERTRRVLVEHFTNTESSEAQGSNKVINNMIGGKPLDAIDIQYHTASPEGDAFYEAYPTGSNVRSNYYNLTQIPFGLIDGDSDVNYKLSDEEQTNLILNAAMLNPEFGIEIEVQNNGSSIIIDNDIEALSDVSDRQLHIISAIVEREVTLSGSSVVYQNVLRQLLPSAAGEYLERDWTKGDNQLYSFSYEIDDFVSNANALNVVTFIQDEVTKEILQAATTDTTSSPFVSIDELFANSKGLDMYIYPNPASKLVGVLLNNVADNNTQVQVFNQQGRLIISEKISEGIQYRQFNVEALQEGVYFINCTQDEEHVIKKLVIVK